MDNVKYEKTKRIGSHLSNFMFAAIFIKHTGGCCEKLCVLRRKGHCKMYMTTVYD